MKVIGFIALAIGAFSFLGALASGYNLAGGIIWTVIGGYLVWRADNKKKDQERKDKWLNGDS